MSRSSKIVIHLLPSSIRAAIMDDRGVVRLEQTPLEPGLWEQAWENELAPLGEAFRAVLTRLEVTGSPMVTVFYQSSTAVAEVFTVPTTGRAAMAAARLALNDLRTCSGPDWASSLEALSAEPARGGLPARTHVLALAERDDVLTTIANFVERNGLRLSRVIPSRAASLTAALRAAESLDTENAMGVLFMSDHETSIVAQGTGGIEMIRCFDAGYLRLAEAIVTAAKREKSATMPIGSAIALLFGAGIPSRGQVVEATLGLRAEQVLPLMQSVLQRYVVEIRQTLRFGLSDATRTRPTLYLSGTGASIPNLANTLTAQLDFPVEAGAIPPITRAADADLAVVGACGTLLSTPIALLPMQQRMRIEKTRLSRAMQAGVAAAMLALAAHGAYFINQRQAVDQRVDALAPKVARIDADSQYRDNLFAFSDQLDAAEATLKSSLGATPPWKANLHALARLAGPQIRISEILGASDSGAGPTITFRGIARPTEARSADDVLSAFLEQASAHPLMLKASLASSRSVVEDAQDVRHFVVTLNLRAARPSPYAQQGDPQ